MLTGLDNPDLALECLSNGPRTYFVKPLHPCKAHAFDEV